MISSLSVNLFTLKDQSQPRIIDDARPKLPNFDMAKIASHLIRLDNSIF
ncbi:hypothetical protein B0I21_104134 [Sphingobacterium paludis]|uniref:Uncharacterized protein n=1 Tax=Sphingobacterium paludis TaxID=1476465 RepID=A0A4V3E1M0_9SPHI|nr:hypothetical protein B0I21_104134 [Sphingobacterium paludis]